MKAKVRVLELGKGYNRERRYFKGVSIVGLLNSPIEGKVVNLTSEPVWAYSASGDIICLEPSWGELGDYYLVSKYSELKWSNLVIALKPGVGRDGVMLSKIVFKNDQKTRVYPTEGQ